MFTDLGSSMKCKQDKLKESCTYVHHSQTDETKSLEGSCKKVAH